MIKEKSCGAVLFRTENHQRFYLILHSTQGHYSLCKGHVERDETEQETAIREIREETALTADFIPGFRQVITYQPKPNTVKDVVFFLAQLRAGEALPQPEEVSEILFLPFDRAVQQLTHLSDRQVLENAEMFIRECTPVNAFDN